MAVIDLTDKMWEELIDATNSINENMSYFEEEAIEEDLKERGIFFKKGYFLGKNGLDAFEKKKYDIFSTAFLAPLKPYLYESFEKRGWWQRTKDKTKGAFYFLLVPKNDYVRFASSFLTKIVLAVAAVGAIYKMIEPTIDKIAISVEEVFERFKKPIKKAIFTILNYVKKPLKKEIDFLEKMFLFSWEGIKKAFWRSESSDESLDNIESFWLKLKDALIQLKNDLISPLMGEEIEQPIPPNALFEIDAENESQIKVDSTKIHPIHLITAFRINHTDVGDKDASGAAEHFKKIAAARYLLPVKGDKETQEAYQKRLDEYEKQHNPFNKESTLHYFTLVNGEWVKRILKKNRDGVFGYYEKNEYGELVEVKVPNENAQEERTRRHKKLLNLAHDMEDGSSNTGLSQITERTIDLTLINSIKNKLNLLKEPALFYSYLTGLHAMFASVANFLVEVYFISKTGTGRKEFFLIRRYKNYLKTQEKRKYKGESSSEISDYYNLDKKKKFYILTSPKRIEVQEKLTQMESSLLTTFKNINTEMTELEKQTPKTELEKPEASVQNNISVIRSKVPNNSKSSMVFNIDKRVQPSTLT